MFEREWSSDERLASTKDLSVASLQSFIKDLLRNVYIRGLFCGNILEDDAKEIVDALESSLIEENKARPLLPTQLVFEREYKLKKNVPYLYEQRSKIHSNSCVYVYFQIGLQNERTNVLSELISQMTEASFFDILRTKEQLGYIVTSGGITSDSVQGFKALIQTDKSPLMVCEKIDDYFEKFIDNIVSMTDGEFKDYVEALSVNKLKKPKKLTQEALNHWDEIACYQFHYRRNIPEVEALRRLTKSDVLEFYKKYILPSSKDRRSVTFVVLGKDAESVTVGNKSWEVVDDILKFKNGLSLYSHVLSYNDIPMISTKKMD